MNIPRYSPPKTRSTQIYSRNWANWQMRDGNARPHVRLSSLPPPPLIGMNFICRSRRRNVVDRLRQFEWRTCQAGVPVVLRLNERTHRLLSADCFGEREEIWRAGGRLSWLNINCDSLAKISYLTISFSIIRNLWFIEPKSHWVWLCICSYIPAPIDFMRNINDNTI